MRELFNRATPNETDTLPDGSQSTNYDKKDESNISTSDSNLALAPSDTDSDLKPATAESGYGFDQRSLPQVQEKQADGLHHTTSNQPSLSEEAVDQHSSSLLETNKSLTPPSEPPATAPSQYEHTMDSPSTLSPSKISEILNETPPEQTGSPSASGSESRSPFSDLLVDSNRQPLTGSQPNENESLDEQQQQSIQRETVYSRVETPLVGAAPPSSESLSSASNEGKKTQPVPSNPDPPRPQTYSKPSSSEKAPPNGSGGGGQSSESIFGQITKRLNYLDSNHDLALKYVEEQSKLLESSLRLLDQRLLEFESQLKSQDVKQKKTLRDLNELKRKLSVERTLHKHQIESLDSSMTFIKSFGLIQFVSILAVLVFLALTRFQETSVTNPSIVTKRPRPLSNLRVETQKNRLNLLKSNLRSKPGFISGKEASSTPKRFHHSHLKCASSVSASAKSPSPLSEFEVLRKPTTVSWLRGSNISSTKVSSFRDLPSSVAQEKVQNQYSRKETKAQGCKLRSLSQSYGGSCAPNLSPQPKPYSLIRPKHARLRSISDCAGLLRPNLTSPMKNVLSGENPQRNTDQLICGNNQFSKTMNTENDVINNNEFLRRTKDDFIFPVEEIRIHGLSFPKGSGSKDAMATYEGCIDSFGNLRSNFDEFKRRQQQQLHHQRNDSCNSHSEWMTECSGVSSSLESEDEEFERLSKISEQGGLIVKTGCIGEEKIVEKDTVEKEGLMNQEFKVKPKVEQCSIDGLPPSYRSAVKVTQ
ncbi:hypothetical protein BY996DRAFT_2151919 [Phakopsora pachyrhizi]|nr:hypothetical protein BY996DRAFT_2151919 [Phakopsora pachyrhizi]